MPPKNLPLRWESTGDQWWFASPIDLAAANGHFDLVRELLYLDTNLLIKLTSLPRIRRLETVWDDDVGCSDVARCRSHVARELLRECEGQKGNSLIGAGYGGWLLYTAASAGDVDFVRELLGRDPLLVFGEGEYGVSDVLYGAARSKNVDVFRMVFDCCVCPKGLVEEELSSVHRSEMANRGAHAAARGGCVAALREVVGGGDVLGYRDARGSTVLHAASGRGQVEVVKHLISSYDIINSIDNRGSTALHVAAYRGQPVVVEVLISSSPSSASLTNNHGDTFLHMAISGFNAPSFRRIDRLTELMKKLVSGKFINMEDIINVRNNDGRTALHVAVIDNVQSDVVELLMSVNYINLNIRDFDGFTPLDLLKQRPRSATSEILIKRLISAGGISNCRDENARNAFASHLRMHGIRGSPGTSFRIPDAEILLYAQVKDVGPTSSCELSDSETGYSGEIQRIGESKYRKYASLNSATRSFKNLLRWRGKNDKNVDASDLDDNYSIESYKVDSSFKDRPLPLRQQFARQSSLPNNKRTMSLPGNLPSPSTKKKFTEGLTRGVLQVLPKPYFGSPSSAFSESSWSSHLSADQRKGGLTQSTNVDDLKMKRTHGSFNLRLMNSYLCFGAQGLAVEKSANSPRQSQKEQSLVV